MGVARVDIEVDGAPSKYVVFVPNVIPGEEVEARIFRNKKTYSEADLVRVLRPSADRVEPVCPHFASCGGCQYQHLDMRAQRAWKRSQVHTCTPPYYMHLHEQSNNN